VVIPISIRGNNFFVMDTFKTPKIVKSKSVLKDEKPLIPDSPMMVKLGYGTGKFEF
jgi:hypothetical protein